MTLVISGVAIILCAFYTLFLLANDIETRSSSIKKKFEDVQWQEVEADHFELGYMHIHDYPNYTPPEILNEDNDKKAEIMIQKWAEKLFNIIKKKEIQIENNGWFFEATYLFDNKKHITRRIQMFPLKDMYNAVHTRMVENKKHTVWLDKNKPTLAFLIKPKKEDIDAYYNEKFNGEFKTLGLVVLLGLGLIYFGI